MTKPVSKYDYERLQIIESLAEKLGNGISSQEIELLRKLTLELTKKERFRISRIIENERIRITDKSRAL